jgi:rfaE bifunctional protein kinase chain/domain
MAKTENRTARLLRIIDRFPRLTITVLGDMVADEFLYGEIARVSREAPVLILKHRERTVVPGGAANAVNNLADLGVTVLPVGIVGDDEAGRGLLHYFRHKRVQVDGIQKLRAYRTVTKTRILAGHTHSARQQVVRLDTEPEAEPRPRNVRDLITETAGYLRTSDALLVADYGYGAATPEMLKALRQSGALDNTVVTLDSRYRILEFADCGITAATPNEAEVEEALGERIGDDADRLISAGDMMIEALGAESLIITRGRDGMVAFQKKQDPVEIPIHGSDEVADVTGAGDTVIATFTAALAAGADPENAARLANLAGGIVVMKRGTATVTADELREAVRSA